MTGPRTQEKLQTIVMLALFVGFSAAASTTSSDLDGEARSREVVVAAGSGNSPGFQEGSIYTDPTISFGANHGCAILDDGTVSCWGYNNNAQLGDGTNTNRDTPTQTSSLGAGRTAVAISSKDYYT